MDVVNAALWLTDIKELMLLAEGLTEYAGIKSLAKIVTPEERNIARKEIIKLGNEKIWSTRTNLTSVESAFEHWTKHAAEFPEFVNAKQYVEGAKKFMNNSPEGTLVKIRANGEILKYHPGTNTFGVADASGIPRTMFRPKKGMEYWLKQK